MRDENIEHRPPRRNRGQRQAFDGQRRQILEAMNGHVGRARQQRPLDFLGKNPLATDLRQRPVRRLIAGRFDFDNLDGSRRGQGAQQVGHEVGLPQGQPAAASANP